MLALVKLSVPSSLLKSSGIVTTATCLGVMPAYDDAVGGNVTLDDVEESLVADDDG